MNIINAARPTVRLFAAMLVAVIVVGLSTLAMHAPAQTQKAVTLKSIQTDRTAIFYAQSRSPDCAWFVELVLPTDGKLAQSGPSPTCAWFVELVLPTGDGKQMAENLQSVAATL